MSLPFRLSSFIFCFFFSLPVIQAQEKEFRFSHLDISDGLSNNQVNAIWKDQQGFMWFGTLSGLNRYDGYNFKTYTYDLEDSTSLSDSFIEKIFEDHQGRLWIKNRRGLNIYDHHTDAFQRNIVPELEKINIFSADIIDILTADQSSYWYVSATQGLYNYRTDNAITHHFAPDSLLKERIHHSQITSAAFDPKGYLWIVHHQGLLEKIDPQSGKVLLRTGLLEEAYEHNPTDFQMMIDLDGDLWLYTFERATGLYLYHVSENELEHFHKEADVGRLNTNIVHTVVQDQQGLIWIGTDHGGINLLDKKNGSVKYILHEAGRKNSLSQNSINSLYQEDNGTIWIGTYIRGIDYYHENLFKFKLIKHYPSDPESLPYEDINTFVEDQKGNLWIGTNGGGLIYYDRQKTKFTQFLHDPSDPASISNNVIISLYLDSQNKLWIGTYHGGLNCFDGKRFIKYRNDPEVASSLAHDRIWDIYEDKEGNIWVGTLGGGLDLLDQQKGIFIHYRDDDINSVSSNYISSIAEDSLGNLWIGNAYGVNVYNKNSGRFIHYLPEEGNKGSLSNININFVYVDSHNNVWIGSRDGLNLYDREDNSFRVFRQEDGLADNTLLAMREDEQHQYWISTAKGLSQLRFEGQDLLEAKPIFTNYSEPEGLQGIEFNIKAACKTSRGEMVFGGPNGFNIFFPHEIKKNEALPKVVLIDLKIFNKSIAVRQMLNDRILLEQSLNDVDQIVLKPDEDMVSFEFAALNFFHPERNEYAYQLEGFNQDWISSSSQSRTATFTNLSPGEYVLKVRASNNDGIWNPDVKTLKISVLPPIWKTQAAYAFYILLLIAGVLLARRIMLERVRLKFMMEQQQQEARQLHELDKMKIKFFTNVSHEFRTPLSLIISPLEKLMKTTRQEEELRQFHLIHRNAKRLLTLVNQLLDFRKMEEQGLSYNPAEGDIIRFIQSTVHSFSDLSEAKNISLTFESKIEELPTHFDQDKLEKILFNLLSNAFKFTPEQGKVNVSLDLEKALRTKNGYPWLCIQVKDTGIGIPKERHGDIFKKFFQNEIPGTLINQGSGIGLSITQDFVKMHGGRIEVESEVGEGACFTVLLPLEPLSVQITQTQLQEETRNDEIALMASAKTWDGSSAENGLPLLLLVEDHEDFRFYLKDNLKAQYRILEARNGKEGWLMSKKYLPELIVSDVMMPEMDGIQFCEKVKNDKRTSHIPVILLTARSAENQKIEGFAAGADDYVGKPFNFEILEVRIRNLIDQRATMRDSLLRRIEVEPEKINISSMDEKLIKSAIKVVEENIANPDFSVEDFSRALGMSRVNLYKKLLALSGKSPIEFIRIIRLKRAAQLLKQSQMTVAEVAYEVGFNNPKYFSKYFKSEYKVLPSQYSSQ